MTPTKVFSKNKSLINNRMKVLRYPVTFIAPALLVYFVFFVLPTISGFYFSFTDWNAMSNQIKFVGLKQFIEVMKNPDLGIAAWNTLIYSITITVVKNIFAIALAVVLVAKIRTKSILRAVYFSPAILNVVAMGLIFQGLLNPYTGFVNNTLRSLCMNFMALGWIADPKLAIHSASIMEIWRATGIAMAIYIAGLQTIPKDYYEASTIDGANEWQKFTKITLPLLMPAITINLILCLIYGLRMFEVIYFLTQGGPGTSSEVLMTLIYKYMGMGMYGYSAAFNMLLVVFIIIISIPILLYMKSKEVDN